jgi:hypothetical protein
MDKVETWDEMWNVRNHYITIILLWMLVRLSRSYQVGLIWEDLEDVDDDGDEDDDYLTRWWWWCQGWSALNNPSSQHNTHYILRMNPPWQDSPVRCRW